MFCEFKFSSQSLGNNPTTSKSYWHLIYPYKLQSLESIFQVTRLLGMFTALVNWITSFLGIPKNSQKFLIMQITLVNWISSFLGIPRNSQTFPTMQISSDLKSLELLGISGKGRHQFCEDLEFLGIPRNSQLYKLPII